MLILLTIPFILFTYCTLPDIEVEKYTRDGFDLPYDFNDPDTVFLLPFELTEISGLSPGPDEGTLACVQDEKGFVFVLDKKTGAVTRKIQFGKNNDYEGLQRVGQSMYIVKSTGTLYEIEDMSQTQTEAIKYSNDLDGDYDVEGLGYDPEEKVLLLACKGRGDDGENDERSIYAFDPISKSLFPDPWYTIKHKAIEEFVEMKRDSAGYEERYYDAMLDKIRDEFNFHPSGICVHPVNGHFYIISSKAHALIVMDRQEKILAYAQLHLRLFPQPEGITIDDDGTIYISSEGNRARGRILVFRNKNI